MRELEHDGKAEQGENERGNAKWRRVL